MEKFVPNKPDGSIDWKLFIVGKSWKQFIYGTLFFIAILMMTYGYWQEHKVLVDIEQHPCDWVVKINQACTQTQEVYDYENPLIIYSNSSGVNRT